MLPIYEWQGILYVGCSRLPAQLPELSEKVVFVLCQPDALKQVWYEFHGTVVADVQASKANLSSPANKSDAPEGLSLDLNVPSAPADDLLGLLDDVSSNSSSENEISPPTGNESSEGLELLDLSSYSSPSDVGNLLSDKTSIISLKPVSEVEVDFPPLASDFAPLSGNENTGDIEVRDLSLESPLVDQKTQIQKPKAPQNPHVTIRSETVTGFASEQKATPLRTEVISKSQKQEPEEVTKSAITALTHTYSGNLDSEMLAIFREMETKFSKVMVLLKTGDQIKPWKWNLEFQFNDSDAPTYSLLPASPLRIVYRTHLPYHGYVISNEFNEKFFRDWNGSQIPEHLTVAPILINDHVIGMLLGISEKPEDESASLLLAEKVATQLTNQIKTRPKALNAA